MRTEFAALAILLASISLVRAQQCGDPPRVDDESLKADIEGKAKLPFELMAEGDVKARVQTLRADVFSKYPDAARARAEAYFQYIFCTNVLGDAKLSPQDKVRLIQDFRQASGLIEAQKEFLSRYDQIQRETGLKDGALARFFREIGEDSVSPDELYPKLMQIAAMFNSLRQQIRALPEGDAIGGLKRQADAALDDGAYERAEAMVAIGRDQIGAVQLIEQGRPNQALTALREVERRLGETGMDKSAEGLLLRGYLYKTYAQAFSASGDRARADQYLERALKTFGQIKDDKKLQGKTTREFAGAINGIGNIHAQRGQHREAIADYQLATSLMPDYAYAWHDMFLSYAELARAGNVDLPAMRHALRRTKETGVGWPGLDPQHIARMEAMLQEFERPATPKRARTPR